MIRSDLAAGPTPEQDHVSQIDATLGKDAARFLRVPFEIHMFGRQFLAAPRQLPHRLPCRDDTCHIRTGTRAAGLELAVIVYTFRILSKLIVSPS